MRLCRPAFTEVINVLNRSCPHGYWLLRSLNIYPRKYRETLEVGTRLGNRWCACCAAGSDCLSTANSVLRRKTETTIWIMKKNETVGCPAFQSSLGEQRVKRGLHGASLLATGEIPYHLTISLVHGKIVHIHGIQILIVPSGSSTSWSTHRCLICFFILFLSIKGLW